MVKNYIRTLFFRKEVESLGIEPIKAVPLTAKPLEVTPLKESEHALGYQLRMPQAVIGSIAQEIISHPQTETGGVLIGVRVPVADRKTLLIPLVSYTSENMREVTRHAGLFQVGGFWTHQYYSWLRAHWSYVFKDFLAKYQLSTLALDKVDFQVLGVWHKHPGTMLNYSLHQDAGTVDHELDTNSELSEFLFPIFVLRQKTKDNLFPHKLTTASVQFSVPLDPNSIIEGVFYCRKNRPRGETLLTPIIDHNDDYPHLPDAPWFLKDQASFTRFQSWQREFLQLGFVMTLKQVVFKNEQWVSTFLKLQHASGLICYVLFDYHFADNQLLKLSLNEPTSSFEPGVGMQLSAQTVSLVQVILPMINYQLATKQEGEK